MKDGGFSKLIELGQDTVLDKLGLQEGRLIDGAVKESVEAEVPEEILTVLLIEEVGLKIVGEVVELLAQV